MSNIQNGRLQDTQTRLNRHSDALRETREDVISLKTKQETISEDVKGIKSDVKELGVSILKVETCIHKTANTNLKWVLGVLGAIFIALVSIEFRGWFLGG